jgi:hypothetical protein
MEENQELKVQDLTQNEKESQVEAKPEEVVETKVGESLGEKPDELHPDKDPNQILIAEKDVKLWKSLESRKRKLFVKAQALLGGVVDPSKLPRRSRREFLRLNSKFEILDKKSRSLAIVVPIKE